ncbi:BACON domain-containing carbohydrate-binding protein, partial [Desulfobacterales bacterium HSG2]|nr:BACON domain-containing carbohydrate-binding protein [Desulfobacterales bacterium HSG2]
APAPDDLDDASDEDMSEEDIVVDEDGTVYIDGIVIEDGMVLEDGTVVSIEDAPGDDEEGDSDVEDEPFALNIQFVDMQTSVAFLPTEEGLELQKQILDSKTRDSEIRSLLPDGRVELTIHIAPGMMVQPELPLKFGLEVRKGMYADLLVWDSDIEQFTDVLTVKDVGPEVEKSVALTLLLPPELIERLKGSIGTSSTFNIVSWIDGTSDIVEVSELDVVDMPDRFTEDRDNKERKAARNDTVIKWSRGYQKNFANTSFGAGIAAHAYAQLGKRGALASADGNAHVWVLGKRFEILGADGKAEAMPAEVGKSYLDLDVRFLNNSIWSYYKEGYLINKGKKSFSKKVEVSKTFVIIIIPVTFTAGARGELGIQWDVDMNNRWDLGYGNFYAKVGPFLDIGAYGSAKINLYLAWGGVKGTLSPLIRDEFWAHIDCPMELRDNRCRLWGKLTFRVYNELWGPHGKFGPFAGYRKPSICYKKICIWGCLKIPYPCLKKVEKWWVLVDWRSYYRKDTLVNWSKEGSIKILCPERPALSVTPLEKNVSKLNGTTTLNVANSGVRPMTWTATVNDASWLTIISGASGTTDEGDSSTITLSYEDNPGEERIGTITVTAPGADGSPQTVKVKQDSAAMEYAGAGIDMDISTADIDPAVTASKDDEVWVAVVAQGVTDLDTLKLNVNFDPTKAEFIEGKEDGPDGTKNFLKQNGGTTIGFTALKTSAGSIMIMNSLSGNNTGEAPDGSGPIAYLKFKVLDVDSDNELTLDNVSFSNSGGEAENVTDLKTGTFMKEPGCDGDFDDDGDADDADLGMLCGKMDCKEGDACWDSKYNLNRTPDASGNQVISVEDYQTFIDVYYNKCP